MRAREGGKKTGGNRATVQGVRPSRLIVVSKKELDNLNKLSSLEQACGIVSLDNQRLAKCSSGGYSSEYLAARRKNLEIARKSNSSVAPLSGSFSRFLCNIWSLLFRSFGCVPFTVGASWVFRGVECRVRVGVNSDGSSCFAAVARLFFLIFPNCYHSHHCWKFPSISFRLLGILFFGINWLLSVAGYLDLLSEFENLCECGFYCIVKSSDGYLLNSDPFVNMVYFIISDSDFSFLCYLAQYSDGMILHSYVTIDGVDVRIIKFSSFTFF